MENILDQLSANTPMVYYLKEQCSHKALSERPTLHNLASCTFIGKFPDIFGWDPKYFDNLLNFEKIDVLSFGSL